MQPKQIDVRPTSPRWPMLTAVLVLLAVLTWLFFALLPPTSILGKADVVGYGICHRISERSFFLDGHQLPLCARCTGTFLGVVVGLTALLLLRRGRASGMAPISVLAILVMFTALWAFDGLNSYLTFFPGAPHLYEPQNWLRLATGMLNGITLLAFAFPIFNFTLWREPSRERIIKNLWELVALLPVLALLTWIIQAQIGFLLYPLAILSSLGVLLMLTMINSMIAAVVLRREGYAQTWLQALTPLTIGAALAILEITGMVLLRAYLTIAWGLPF